MKYLARLVLLAVVLVGGYFLWQALFPGPKRVIRHQLTKLAQLASYTAGEGDLAKMLAAERISGFFADRVELVLNIPGAESLQFDNRTELKQAVVQMRKTVRGFDAKFLDLDIEVTPGSQAAIVKLTLEAKAGRDSELIEQELQFNLKKVDGQWLIHRIQTVKTLR